MAPLMATRLAGPDVPLMMMFVAQGRRLDRAGRDS